MKTSELLEKHPLTTEVLRTWFFEQMIKSFNDETVPEEFKEMMKQEGVTNERLAILIDVQPRTLFDVFDENDLSINIERSTSSIVEWSWGIVPGPQENSVCKSRKEAEAFAIKAAFEILEEKLTPIELPKLEE